MLTNVGGYGTGSMTPAQRYRSVNAARQLIGELR